MYKEDVSLSTWVGGTQQRDRSNKNKIRPGREDLLDTKLGFLWISDTLAARRPSATDDDTDSEALTNSVPPSPGKSPDETEEPQVGGRLEAEWNVNLPTKGRPRTRSGDSLRQCGQETGRTNQRGTANARRSASKKDGVGGREEEDSKPSPVTSGDAGRISSATAQEVVQEEATPDAYLQPGWTSLQVELDR